MGKKKKRKSKRPTVPSRLRTEAAYFRTVPNTTSIELVLDPQTGRVLPKTACEAAYTSVTYPRNNPARSDKVVNRVFSPTGEPMLDADSALQLFDFRVAIDTNTKNVGDQTRSVVGIVVGDHVRYGVPYCIELADVVKGTEERVGWKLAIEHLIDDGFLDIGVSTIVVVDAHLGEIEQINKREQPILGDVFLPTGWTMSYASADVGSEYAVNRMLMLADRTATDVMKHLAATGISLCSGPVRPALHGQPRKIYSKRNRFSSWDELRAAMPAAD